MPPDLQLCFDCDDLPTPPPMLVEALPEPAVAAAVMRLARLIARATRPGPAAVTGAEDGDD